MLVVVFKGRYFVLDKHDKATWGKMIRYGETVRVGPGGKKRLTIRLRVITLDIERTFYLQILGAGGLSNVEYDGARDVRSDSQRRDTKNRILDVAESLFSRQGFDGTGIEQIAREVGITKSVIYYHFKNKEAVLAGIFERARSRFERAKQQNTVVFPKEDSIGTILVKTLAGSEGLEPYKSIIRIMFMETMKPGNPDPLFDLWDGNVDFILDHCDERLSAGVREDIEVFRLESFFLYFVPIVGLLAFEESWSARYGTQRGEVRSHLLATVAEMFEHYVAKRGWRSTTDEQGRNSALGEDTRAGGDFQRNRNEGG